ncbi:hypothetical protein [Pedobacter endophyticus]|uniref:RES domain-containing protein n=1 Tax=Pedobacter endophyticus TaxID=2789740 RepID=A0A7U3Q5I5_9SPHI|nr:hypothetical protein [Pedobacter endophyticus]QPH38684.1 hypothetical protein IZT61_16605 [Pedobacter endophyticus]
MSLRTVYQTLKDRNNNDEVVAHGPYLCNKSNAWLHEGYYFWEEFIEPAHHWGKTWCAKKYIITRGDCLIFEHQLFDLVGNLHHIRLLKETVEFLKGEGLVTEETTVAHIIDFLKKEGVFGYLATRAHTTDSFRKKYKLDVLKYEVDKETVLVMNPAVQICIYDLDSTLFSEFRIVYPDFEQIA